MTRFARAKGSKSSNERVPEAPTSWSDMKKQLKEKKEEVEINQKRNESNKKRLANYKVFLEEVENDKTKEVKWSVFDQPNVTPSQNGKITKKKHVNISDDEAPAEYSAKLIQADVKVTKKKLKKKPLKIVVEREAQVQEIVQNETITKPINKVEPKGDGNKKIGKKQKQKNVSNQSKPIDQVDDKLKIGNKKIGKKQKQGNVSNQTKPIEQVDKPQGDSNKKIGKKQKQGNVSNQTKPIEQVDKPQGDGNKKIGKKRKQETDSNQATVKKAKKDASTNVKSKKQKGGKAKPPPPKPKKDISEMTEEEKQKFEKTKVKKMRQLEKRKLKKLELKMQREEAEKDPNYVKPSPKPKQTPQKIEKKNNPANKPERRKQPQPRMIVNGREIDIAYVDGFPIRKEDAERINTLRKQMISKGLPRSEINIALKLERRKAEKSFTRERKNVCFNCRQSGHNLSECPLVGAGGSQQLVETAGTGICFKCGSTEHTHFACKVVKGEQYNFATCFICKESGHIAKQCPDNAKGLYPKVGACKVCGDVTHLKRDCPKFQTQQAMLQDSFKIGTFNGSNPDALDDEIIGQKPIVVHRPNKVIKF